MGVRALGIAVVLAACGGPQGSAKPPRPEVSAAPTLACPESIVAGGDPAAAVALDGKSVALVCVVGGTEAARHRARQAVGIQPGERMTGVRVRTDLGALMQLGIFDDVAAYALPVPGDARIVLLYAVHERPRVADIAFAGDVQGKTSLGAQLQAVTGQPYDPVKVNAIAQAVRDEYVMRGHASCTVKIVTEPATAPDHVQVRVHLDPGPVWRLTKLDFRGARRLREAELRKAAGLVVGDPYVELVVERAGLLVSALYLDRGFLDQRLTTRDVATADGARAITFVIEEGEPFTIRALHATGLGAAVEKELLAKVVRTRPKQVFSRARVLEDLERVKAYFARTDQQVDVKPVLVHDMTKKVVDLSFEVTPAGAAPGSTP